MNTDNTAADKSDNRVLALTAFILFLIGFLLPFLILVLFVFFRPFAGALALVLTFLPFGAELLALVFGLMSWRLKLGKTATVGAVLFWVIYVINLIRFYHH